MAELISKDLADRAINQLLSVIVGGKDARATDSLKGEPTERVKKCMELTIVEYSEAAQLLTDCVPDAKRMVSQCQRKQNSLHSLAVLCKVIKKTEWD
tara:strand:- start:566 stop:856 length:291 start_codon:yes stop_codon:yes gene_type:complete